jgi:hypothetical protein
MKKIILTTLICCAFLNAFPQAWVDIGAKGAFNSTWLLNSNFSGDRNSGYDFSFGYAAGGKIGFNFNEVSEITLDVLYSNAEQKYFSTGLATRWTRRVTLQYLDFPLLYRNTKEGSYIEIGPQYSLLMGASDENSSTGTMSGAKERFSEDNLSAVFGFGSYIAGTENLYLTLGMRFVYGFKDVISDKGGRGEEYRYLDPSSTKTAAYKSTNLLYGGFVLELNYDLGYLVSSRCGKRKVLFF